MRACRCVSERRSRASAEVIGQYQSQPRDNHSPAMRLADACERAVCACVYVSAKAFLRVRHSCKTNYSSLPSGVSHRTSRFSEREREIEFAYDLPEIPAFAKKTRTLEIRSGAGNSASIAEPEI